MTTLYYVLFIIAGTFILFRVFVLITGHWLATLNSVITQYIAWKQMEPDFTDEEIFDAVLDHRFPMPKKDVFVVRHEMHTAKNEVKQLIKDDIKSGMSVIDKFNLPVLIYTCLAIEKNTFLYKHRNKTIEEAIRIIKEEVIRKGFEKYT
jgi:hypothetical protein